jgi:hypothetical protein
VYCLRGTKHPNVLHAAQSFVSDHAYLLTHAHPSAWGRRRVAHRQWV